MTAQTANQSIDLPVALANAVPARYPLNEWTPENWYLAVLELPLVNEDDRHLITHKLKLMRGWRWNLIPMFILGFVLVGLVIVEVLKGRKSKGTYEKAAAADSKA